MSAEKLPETGKVELTILVPVLNEEDSIGLFLETITPVLESLGNTYEILFVDDGSRDQTPAIIYGSAKRDPRVNVIILSRNFGKEAALSCGLDHARGEAVIPMDVDMQDPPNLIPLMVERWREGSDIVLAVRRNRKDDSWFKRNSANAFYSLISKMTSVDIVPNAGDFRLMDRKVIEALKLVRERNRFMKGLMSWPGFMTTKVYYDRPPRAKGTSKWNGWKLWNFALDGIFGFSSIPLRVWTYIGGLIALASFFYAAFIVVRTLLLGVAVPGYASTITLILFLNGLLMISNGIQGEYIARMFEEVKARPLYLVRERIGRGSE